VKGWGRPNSDDWTETLVLYKVLSLYVVSYFTVGTYDREKI
jgi:hypothetical protein